jgi:hypothetical protein
VARLAEAGLDPQWEAKAHQQACELLRRFNAAVDDA